MAYRRSRRRSRHRSRRARRIVRRRRAYVPGIGFRF